MLIKYPNFYITVLLSVVCCLLPVFLWRAIQESKMQNERGRLKKSDDNSAVEQHLLEEFEVFDE